MPKLTEKLTEKYIESLAPREGRKQYDIYDSKLSGLGLCYSNGGARTWFVFWRDADGKSRRTSIGRHDKGTTASEARSRARAKLAEIAKEIKAGINRPTERQAATMGDLIDRISRTCGRPCRAVYTGAGEGDSPALLHSGTTRSEAKCLYSRADRRTSPHDRTHTGAASGEQLVQAHALHVQSRGRLGDAPRQPLPADPAIQGKPENTASFPSRSREAQQCTASGSRLALARVIPVAPFHRAA